MGLKRMIEKIEDIRGTVGSEGANPNLEVLDKDLKKDDGGYSGKEAKMPDATWKKQEMLDLTIIGHLKDTNCKRDTVRSMRVVCFCDCKALFRLYT